MSRIRRKPPISWSQYYEEMLFDLWENIRNLKAESGTKNVAIYKNMAQKLDDSGFIGIDWKAVRSKMHNLKRKYRYEAKEPVSDWIHFKRLNKMFNNWRPENPRYPTHQKESCKEINKQDEETDYLNEYLDANAEILEGERYDQCWEDQMDLWSPSGILNEDESPTANQARKSAGQKEITAVEAGMLAASKERNKELKKLREEVTHLGRRRLGILERLENTLNRMEGENAKFHRKMLEKNS